MAHYKELKCLQDLCIYTLPIGVHLNSQLLYSVQQQILPNFIQIGQHMGEWRRKHVFGL